MVQCTWDCSADLLLNRALFVLQAHRDMEERPEGVVNEYAQLARVTERLRSNVHAQLICRAYYISYAYTRVRNVLLSVGT